jgi:hypothetical protein
MLPFRLGHIKICHSNASIWLHQNLDAMADQRARRKHSSRDQVAGGGTSRGKRAPAGELRAASASTSARRFPEVAPGQRPPPPHAHRPLRARLWSQPRRRAAPWHSAPRCDLSLRLSLALARSRPARPPAGACDPARPRGAPSRCGCSGGAGGAGGRGRLSDSGWTRRAAAGECIAASRSCDTDNS